MKIRMNFSCIFRYNREEVVRSLGKEVNLNPPLTLGQLPDTPEELLKLDQVNTMNMTRIEQNTINLMVTILCTLL